MATAARDLGLDYIVLTDHSPRLTIAHGLTVERLREQLAVVDDLNRQLAPFRILTGIEVDILPDGALDQEDELLARLDVVVGSVHFLLRMESAPMTDRLLHALENPNLDILGHCTGQMTRTRGDRPPSTFDARAVFEAARRHDKAVEVNTQPARRDPPDELLDLAVDLGCLVSIDSDSHSPIEFDWLLLGCDRVAERGVPPERIVNCWAADELIAWTAAHEAGRPGAQTAMSGDAT
jgi:putative hydrolase